MAPHAGSRPRTGPSPPAARSDDDQPVTVLEGVKLDLASLAGLAAGRCEGHLHERQGMTKSVRVGRRSAPAPPTVPFDGGCRRPAYADVGTKGIVDFAPVRSTDRGADQPLQVDRVVSSELTDRPAGISPKVQQPCALIRIGFRWGRRCRRPRCAWNLVRPLGIVDRPMNVIAKDRPRLVDLAHPPGIPASVRVVPAGKDAVGSPDDLWIRQRVYLETLIRFSHTAKRTDSSAAWKSPSCRRPRGESNHLDSVGWTRCSALARPARLELTTFRSAT